ncbi:MAG: hypothetical protein KY397_06285 [Gemmatimonadetes bacterium]|nr:hypothetical protein [Gemmatimonadota bacterium]
MDWIKRQWILAASAIALIAMSTAVFAQQTGERHRAMPDSARMHDSEGMMGDSMMTGMMSRCMRMMGSMEGMGGSMMMDGAEDPDTALRNREELDLSDEQVAGLEEVRKESRESRRAAMAAMREARDRMRAGARSARDRTLEILDSEQRARLETLEEAREACPMMRSGAGMEGMDGCPMDGACEGESAESDAGSRGRGA